MVHIRYTQNDIPITAGTNAINPVRNSCSPNSSSGGSAANARRATQNKKAEIPAGNNAKKPIKQPIGVGVFTCIGMTMTTLTPFSLEVVTRHPSRE